MANRFHKRVQRHSPGPVIDVRKVHVSAVPFGSDISRNGKTVWAAYDEAGQLVCVAPTAVEARRQYRLLDMASHSHAR